MSGYGEVTQEFRPMPGSEFDLDAPDQLSEPGSVPLPEGDFEPFFSEYADYDAALEQSLTAIHDLGIPQALPMANSSMRPYDIRYASDSVFYDGDTLTLKDSSSPQKPPGSLLLSDALSPPRPLDFPLSSPPSSPVRPVRRMPGHARTDSLGISGLQQPRSPPVLFPSSLTEPITESPLRSSVIPGSPHSPHHLGMVPATPMTPSGRPPVSHISPIMSLHAPSSPFMTENNYENDFPHRQESSFTYQLRAAAQLSPTKPMSSPSYPAPQPRLRGGEFDADEESIYGSSAAGTPSPELSYSHHSTSPFHLHGDKFKWQPILTVPQEQVTSSEKIIESQRPRKNLRKSCLPPGAVDEYVEVAENGIYTCLYPNCGRLFRRRYNLRSHIQTHLSDRPYSCNSCGACFVRPHDLRRHIRVHSNDKEFLCPCGKGFNRQDALMRHRYRQICKGAIEPSESVSRTLKKRGKAALKVDAASPTRTDIDSNSE